MEAAFTGATGVVVTLDGMLVKLIVENGLTNLSPKVMPLNENRLKFSGCSSVAILLSRVGGCVALVIMGVGLDGKVGGSFNF